MKPKPSQDDRIKQEVLKEIEGLLTKEIQKDPTHKENYFEVWKENRAILLEHAIDLAISKTREEFMKAESNRVCWQGVYDEAYNKAISEVRKWFMKKAEYYGWFGFTDVIDEFDKKFGKVG